MSTAPSRVALLEEFTDEELRALLAGATWYAKYHERMIAEQADDESTLAVTRREHFHNLHGALRKLGVRLRRPAGLTPAA